MILDFTKSGDKSTAKAITLADVQETCLKHGFLYERSTSSDPTARRADVVALFRVLGCTSLSTFKSAWASEKLPSPKPGMTPHILEKDKEQKEEVTWRTYDVAEYDRLSASYEDPKTMKWKLLPKPGGQAVKPEDYYTLKACIKQVEEGDPPKEQPMWTENGAVDYNGRALFQEWNKLKGKTKDEAKQAFCYAYGKALSEQRFSLNFRKY
ncbi:unnamed protein product [Bathycoccus prasinos]